MTRGIAPSRRLLRLASAAASALLFAGLGLVTAPAALASEVPCSGDTCDDGAWLVARGAANDVSYWGMSPGHNCTNYVAWRLTSAGVEKPRTHPGNAADWAENAIVDGYLVDGSPSVGAVAHWGAFDGYGELGHVAYVERVNDDGTILISEDYWRDGQQIGPLTYRIVDADSPTNYIHYVDESDWLRTASLETDGWTASATHLDIAPTAMAALSLIEGSAELFYSEDGRLWQASAGTSGWIATDTGIPSHASSLSAVSMNGLHPYLMSLDEGELVMTVRTDFGWQRMPTGLSITGEMSAVDLGGLWPTVYVSANGRLWQAWGDMEGWHLASTGVAVSGRIGATVDAQGRPVVFSIRSGILERSWLDGSEWYSETTGIPAGGALSVVGGATGSEVFLIDEASVYRVHIGDRGWTKELTRLDGSVLLSAVDVGETAPLVLQIG